MSSTQGAAGLTPIGCTYPVNFSDLKTRKCAPTVLSAVKIGIKLVIGDNRNSSTGKCVCVCTPKPETK